MIVLSLVLVLAAAVVLGVGVVLASVSLIIVSIACCVVAALLLYLGVRAQRRQSRSPVPRRTIERPVVATVGNATRPRRADNAQQPKEPAAADAQQGPEDGPEDEPAEEETDQAAVSRVSTGSEDVWVVDGRPRFHVAGCAHLPGRPAEALPVWEALELEFTPCGLCRPVEAIGGGQV